MKPFSFIKSGASFDPATLSLTAWFRASFAASPWVGNASAGASGSRNATEATNPPSVGAAINSLDTADFDGTNDRLTIGPTANFFGASAGSAWILLHADAAVADPGAASPYSTSGLICDQSGAGLGIGLTTSGFRAGFYDLSSWDSAITACSLSNWHLCQTKWNGSQISVRVDSGSWVSVARNPLNISGNVFFGQNYSAGQFNGRMADVGLSNTVISDLNFDNIKSYINTRYALVL